MSELRSDSRDEQRNGVVADAPTERAHMRRAFFDWRDRSIWSSRATQWESFQEGWEAALEWSASERPATEQAASVDGAEREEKRLTIDEAEAQGKLGSFYAQDARNLGYSSYDSYLDEECK